MWIIKMLRNLFGFEYCEYRGDSNNECLHCETPAHIAHGYCGVWKRKKKDN